MVCRTKTRVSLWLVWVLCNPPIIKWWIVMSGYSIGLFWVETDSCTVLLLWKIDFFLSFPQNGWLILYWKCIFNMMYFSISKALLKTLLVNNMGVSSRLCYFSIDGKQKRNDNAKKIKPPRRKTWEEFSFPAPFFSCFIMLPFKES